MRKTTAPVYFQRLATKWAFEGPPALALGALVNDQFRATHNPAILSKVENHMTSRVFTDQERFHGGSLAVRHARRGAVEGQYYECGADDYRRSAEKETTKLNYAVENRIPRNFNDGTQAELQHHSGSICFNGPNADTQHRRHFFVGLSLRQKPDHLALPAAELVFRDVR